MTCNLLKVVLESFSLCLFITINLLFIVALLTNDLSLHRAHANEHKNGNTELDIQIDDLEVDPLLKMGIFFVHFSFLLVVEDSDIDDHTDSKEVVHFEKQSEGTLLTVEVDSVKFDELVESLERIKDEKEPEDEVVAIFICRVWEILAILHDLGLHSASIDSQAGS